MKNLKKMLPACGFAIAVALVGLTSAFKEAPKTDVDVNSQYALAHFRYDPQLGTEDQREAWILISPEEYDELECETGVRGCSMEADLNPTDNHPIEVHVNNTTDLTPITGTHVTEVKNQDD